MLKSAFISSAEASMLIDLIRGRNEYVMAAYDLYTHDNDLEELKDTLHRCAKLELRRKVANQEERRIYNLKKSQYDDDDDEDDDDYEDDYEDEDDEEDDDDNDAPQSDSRANDLDGLLGSLGITNTDRFRCRARWVVCSQSSKGSL
jgi:hypothetical protein